MSDNTRITTGRLQQGGRLVVHKHDFNCHWLGTDFRHLADQIDMNPPIGILGTGTTVQQTLEELENFVSANGSGFISIGNAGADGYAVGSYNVGSIATPTFNDAFSAALQNKRLENGGVILILAGTYHIENTVTVPPGITILGENAGTILVADTNEDSIFLVDFDHKTVNIGGDSGSGPIPVTIGSNLEEVRFQNLILSDNFDGYTNSSEPNMTTVPMISIKNGSNVYCERVSFIGRLQDGAVSARFKTKSAIEYISGGGSGTTLTVRNCFFDGLKVGITFNPGSNDSDFLTVTNCKARIYGTEDSLNQTFIDNSFITTTQCNLIVNNNYFVGAGAYVNTMVYIISGDGTNTKAIISNNIGLPNTTGNIIQNNTGSYFNILLQNNRWDTQTDNSWFVTIDSSNTTNPHGDFFGSNALQLVLSLLNTQVPQTIIINSGTYLVTGNATSSNNFTNLKLIGNPTNNSYPIVNLNLSSSTTDNLSNRPFTVGSYLSNINFVSLSHKHSIRPSFTATTNTSGGQTTGGLIEINNCNFTNISLFCQDLATYPWLDSNSVQLYARIKIHDCQFYQTGTFTDTANIVCPLVDFVEINNCYLNGSGYAIQINSAGYTGGSAPLTSVILKNVFCEMLNHSTAQNYTISSVLPGSFSSNYININLPIGKILVDNLQVYTGSDLSPGSPNNTISTTLTNAGTFVEFIKLTAEEIEVINSILTGPTQTTKYGGSTPSVAIPTLLITPTNSGRISGCKFWNGALPIQIGTNALNNTTFTDHIIIENNGIQSGSQTAIDFDVAAAQQDEQPKITIQNNTIQAIGTAWPVHHATSVISSPIAHAAIQLFAGDANVNILHNQITSTLSALTETTVTIYAGIYTNTEINQGTTNDQNNVTNIYGNTVQVQNSYGVADSTASIVCLYCTGSSLMIQHNYLEMNNSNTDGGSLNFTGCLAIDNLPWSGSSNFSTCLVANNVFSRILSTLIRGYIQISSNGTTPGAITNNYIDSTTYDGTTTALVENNSSATWKYTRNIHQTDVLTISASSGTTGIATGGDTGSSLLVFYGGVVSPSRINGTTANYDKVVFDYTNTTNADEFKWTIPLKDILPNLVKIDAINYTYQSSVAVGTVFATIQDSTGTDTDSNSVGDTSTHVRSVTLSHTYITTDTQHPRLIIGYNVTNAASVVMTISAVTITYHY